MGCPDTVVHSLVDCDGTLIAGSATGVDYWSGSDWLPVGGETNAGVTALVEFGGALHGAGDFSNLGSTSSQHISRWGGQQVGVEDPIRPPVVLSAFPNPFASGATLVYELERSGAVRLDVFDIQGRRRAEVAGGFQPSGHHEFGWDGNDDQGRRLPAGMYYLRLSTPDGAQTQKLVRVR